MATHRMSADGHGDIVLTKDEVCSIPVTHAPTPHLLVRHHVKPESWGGSALDGLVLVCPTCHMNVHVLIDLYVKAGGPPSWEVRRLFSVEVRRLAQRAWDVRPAVPNLTL